jgi:hypothetical protein
MSFRLNKAGWYLRRARVMGPAELVHRVGEQSRLAMLRAAYVLGRTARRGAGRHDRRRLSFCAATAPQLPDVPWAFGPDDAARRALLEGRVQALGCAWVWRPDPAVWHEAPDTGRQWPRGFFASIPYRPDNPVGDVRVAWEPARLQHLVGLATLARLSGDEERDQAVRLIEAQLASWRSANPALDGIHYISAMECALRLIAVCHALDLIRPWLADPDGAWRALLELVESHADLIAARWSAHSSRGNHTVAEGAGLVYAGALFPEFPRSGAWAELGLRLMETSAADQILPDGGGREQAVWYHLFLADLYGLVARLLEHRGLPARPALRHAHERAASFLNELAGPEDDLPRIGDGDSGHALSPLLRISARSGGRPAGLTSFPDSGYSVIRATAGEEATLILDHGPLGLPPAFGHGHADALSVVLNVGGRELLVDPGTYTYGGDPRWRAYFRGTSAHNSVVVDGLDQAVQEGAFLWSRPYAARLCRQAVEADGTITLLAVHDGYLARAGVLHWRGVRYQPPGRWLIWDCLAGPGEHELALHWHIAGSVASDGEGFVVAAGERRLRLHVAGGTAALHRGDIDPILGWRSPAYGVLEPITTLRVAWRASLPHEFVTTISPKMVSGTFSEKVPDAVLFRRWVDEAEAGANTGRAG